MTSKIQIAAVVRQIRQEQGVESYNGKRTKYTLDNKKHIIDLYKAGTDTVAAIVYHLKKEGLGAGWEMMLRSWVEQEAAGLYNTAHAISVTSRKPVDHLKAQLEQFEELVEFMLQAGITSEDITAAVQNVLANQAKRQDVKELKALLASRGLTVEDLK